MEWRGPWTTFLIFHEKICQVRARVNMWKSNHTYSIKDQHGCRLDINISAAGAYPDKNVWGVVFRGRVPLILSIFLCFWGFHHSDRFFGGFEPRNPPNYAHDLGNSSETRCLNIKGLVSQQITSKPCLMLIYPPTKDRAWNEYHVVGPPTLGHIYQKSPANTCLCSLFI